MCLPVLGFPFFKSQDPNSPGRSQRRQVTTDEWALCLGLGTSWTCSWPSVSVGCSCCPGDSRGAPVSWQVCQRGSRSLEKMGLCTGPLFRPRSWSRLHYYEKLLTDIQLQEQGSNKEWGPVQPKTIWWWRLHTAAPAQAGLVRNPHQFQESHKVWTCFTALSN